MSLIVCPPHRAGRTTRCGGGFEAHAYSFSLISCSKRSLKWSLFLKNAFLLWILLTKSENFNKIWELIWHVLNAVIKQSSAEHLFSKNFGGVFVCVSVSECSVCVSAGLHVHICGLAEIIACPSLSLFPCSFENPPLRQDLSWNLEFMGLSARLELKKLHSPLVSILVRAGFTGAHRTLGLLSSCWEFNCGLHPCIANALEHPDFSSLPELCFGILNIRFFENLLVPTLLMWNLASFPHGWFLTGKLTVSWLYVFYSLSQMEVGISRLRQEDNDFKASLGDIMKPFGGRKSQDWGDD